MQAGTSCGLGIELKFVLTRFIAWMTSAGLAAYRGLFEPLRQIADVLVISKEPLIEQSMRQVTHTHTHTHMHTHMHTLTHTHLYRYTRFMAWTSSKLVCLSYWCLWLARSKSCCHMLIVHTHSHTKYINRPINTFYMRLVIWVRVVRHAILLTRIIFILLLITIFFNDTGSVSTAKCLTNVSVAFEICCRWVSEFLFTNLLPTQCITNHHLKGKGGGHFLMRETQEGYML